MMARATCLLAVLLLARPALGQEFQRRPAGDRSWKVLSTAHLDVHIDDDALMERARHAAAVLEAFHSDLEARLGLVIARRTPVFLYRSHARFEATTTIPGGLPDETTTLAFTAFAQDRLVMPVYPGAIFDDILRHEYGHVAQANKYIDFPGFDILRMSFVFADWFMEGFAEYLSADGLSPDDDMILRDLVLTRRLRPLDEYFSFAHLNFGETWEGYVLGHAIFEFMDEVYGKGTPERMFRFYAHLSSSHDAVERATADRFEPFVRKFDRWLERRYGQQAEGRTPPPGKRVTDTHRQYYRVYNLQPRYLPDGGVACLSTREDKVNVVVQRPGQSGRPLVSWLFPQSLEQIHRRWSGISVHPAGNFIACVGEYGVVNHITLLPLQGGSRRVLELPGLDEIYSPAFSPRGDRLAFSGQKAGVTDIYVVALNPAGEADPASLTRLTGTPAHDNHPAWSPDGEYIYFDSEGEDGAQICRVALAGGAVERVTTLKGGATEPCLSADGQALVFVHAGDLARMALPAGQVEMLTQVTGGVASPSLSADGLRLLYSAYDHGRWDVMEVELAHLSAGKATEPPQDQAREAQARARRDRVAQLKERFAGEAFNPYRRAFKLDHLLPLGLINSASVSDPSGEHRFELNLGTIVVGEDLDGDGTDDSDDEAFGADLSYENRVSRADIRLTVFRGQEDASVSHNEDIDETQTGGIVGANYALSSQVALTAGYTTFHFTKRYEIREHLDVDHWVAGVFAAASASTLRGQGLGVSGGTKFSLEGAGFDRDLGGQRDFQALGLETQYFRSIVPDHVVALRLRGDKSFGEELDRFDLGGFTGLRGIRSHRLEGANRAITSVEYRFPIVRDINREFLGMLLKDLRGALFSDQGFVTDDRRGVQSHDLRHAIGANLRFDFFVIQQVPLPLALEALRRTDTGRSSEELRISFGMRF